MDPPARALHRRHYRLHAEEASVLVDLDVPLPERVLEQLSPHDLIALLLAQEARHAAEMAAMQARIAELEARRLSLNSSNSGKPPSSDGLKKPVRVSSLREPSGKKPGGQKGHPGETLCRTETPDAIIDHYPPACAWCGALLTEAMATSHVARQEFDLPEPQPLAVTEHRAHDCRCAACGAQTRAAFPDWVAAPVQYGKRIGAVVLSNRWRVAAKTMEKSNIVPRNESKNRNRMRRIGASPGRGCRPYRDCRFLWPCNFGFPFALCYKANGNEGAMTLQRGCVTSGQRHDGDIRGNQGKS